MKPGDTVPGLKGMFPGATMAYRGGTPSARRFDVYRNGKHTATVELPDETLARHGIRIEEAPPCPTSSKTPPGSPRT